MSRALLIPLLLFSPLFAAEEMPPEPPVFAIERIISAPRPPYMLLTPHLVDTTNDAAMVTLVWDYTVPTSSIKPPVVSPKAAESFTVPMRRPPPRSLILRAPPSLAPQIQLTLVTEDCGVYLVPAFTSQPSLVTGMNTMNMVEGTGYTWEAITVPYLKLEWIAPTNAYWELEWSTNLNNSTWNTTNLRYYGNSIKLCPAEEGPGVRKFWRLKQALKPDWAH